MLSCMSFFLYEFFHEYLGENEDDHSGSIRANREFYLVDEIAHYASIARASGRTDVFINDRSF